MCVRKAGPHQSALFECTGLFLKALGSRNSSLKTWSLPRSVRDCTDHPLLPSCENSLSLSLSVSLLLHKYTCLKCVCFCVFIWKTIFTVLIFIIKNKIINIEYVHSCVLNVKQYLPLENKEIIEIPEKQHLTKGQSSFYTMISYF